MSPSKRYVFLVIGSETEGSGVLACFEAKRDAETLVKACDDHSTNDRPFIPNPGDTPEETAAFDKAWAKFIRWQKKHPGGVGAHFYETFSVQRIRIQPPSQGKD